MKAIVQSGYGSPDVLALKDVAKPAITDDQVPVRVHAISINAGDYFSMRGSPWLVRISVGFPKPKDTILGWDMAGRVEAMGSASTQFQPGDAVFGAVSHVFAEYVAATASRLAPKPANLSFEQAAAVPTAGLTALQGLRDAGQVQPGQKVLINGAAGGVGTFAVQIGKVLGAQVTGVCSTANLDLVRSLGAVRVIDYTQDDFTRDGPIYDVVFDAVAKVAPSHAKKALKTTGVYLNAHKHSQGQKRSAAGTQGADRGRETAAGDRPGLPPGADR